MCNEYQILWKCFYLYVILVFISFYLFFVKSQARGKIYTLSFLFPTVATIYFYATLEGVSEGNEEIPRYGNSKKGFSILQITAHLRSDFHKPKIFYIWISRAFQNCLIDVERKFRWIVYIAIRPSVIIWRRSIAEIVATFQWRMIVMLINFLNHVECVFLRRGRIYRGERKKQQEHKMCSVSGEPKRISSSDKQNKERQ